jgi:S1-C subfamily serine protease
MKHLTAIFCLTLVILLGSVGKSFALPQCKGSPFVFTTINDISAWDGCEGTVTFGPSSKFSGDKYVGEFRNSIPNGQGTYTYGPSSKWAGDKYVGEYRDNKRNGQGTYTRANGQITEGIWKDDKFQYAQKGSPTVTARKSAPPSSSAAEIENEKLRRENARLRKQKQSIPKTDVALAKRTQEALQVLGLYSGKLDGVIGVRTRLAIRGWQKRNGYSESGEITETQIVKLEQDATRHLAKQQSKPKQIAKRPKSKPKSGSTGSGFFVSKKGHVITNQHVVDNCKKVTIGDNAQKQVTADVLETDRRNDLALLKISSLKMASVETKSLIQKLGLKLVPLASDGLMRSEDVELGEKVLVAGYPYGEMFSDSIKVTGGMVSSNRGLGDDTGQFQMDAAVQPGNSGGPIYDENGNIVGVVVAQLNKMKFAKQSGSIPENVNFGIKASTVRQFLNASGLPTKWSKRSKRMNTRELAKIAKNQTVMVVCNR